MRRLAVVMAALFVALLPLSAQNKRIKVKNFSKGDLGDMRARTSPVLDRNGKLTALLDITFTESDSTMVFEGAVGEPVHFPGEWLIHVPEGAGRVKISMEDCKPLEFSFPQDAIPESGMTYLLDLDIEEAVKLRTLIMPQVSLAFSKPIQPSYGIMVGYCKRNGGFVHVKTNFNLGLKTTGSCDADGMIDGVKGWYTGSVQRSRHAITAGYMRHLLDRGEDSSLYAYVGAGYGARTVAWQSVGEDGSSQWVKVAPSSLKGAEIEFGAIMRFGGFVVSAGIQTNSFRLWETNLGVGVMF